MREVNGIDPGLNYKTKPNLRTPHELVGRVEVDAERVAADFDPDVSAIARFGMRELANHAATGTHRGVDGPIAPYLKG
jgi:hypothetical protein